MEADSVAAGVEALDSAPVGAIVDINLPDGDGLDLVEELRKRSPTTPVLVTTASDAAIHANRAHLLGASLARKPSIDANVTMFLSEVQRDAAATQRDTEQLLERLASEVRFSPQQRRIVELMLAGTKRSELAAALGVEESTIRTHVRGIVTRVGVENLDRVAWRLLALLNAPLPAKADARAAVARSD